MGLFRRYLSRENLTRLESYKYAAGEYTVLDNALNSVWNRLIDCVPTWIAPNTLTLLGFLCSCGAFTVLATYSSDFDKPAPPGVYIAAAVLTWGYQTLDALDGKQARRTGTSSSLGTLFDHGCDIITGTLLLASAAVVIRLGGGVLAYWVIAIAVQATQFTYLWWEYHFHVFISNPGYSAGVTEAQCCFMAICLISAFFGPDIWLTDLVSYLPSPVRRIFYNVGIPRLPLNATFSVIISANNMLANTILVANAVLNRMAAQSFVHRGLALLQWLAFMGYLCTFGIVWEYGYNQLQISPVQLSLFSAVAYGTYSIRLLLASTSNRNYSPLQWPLIPVILLSVAAECASRGLLRRQWAPGYRAYMLTTTFMCIYLGDLVYGCIQDITRLLGIYCFSITKRRPPQATKTRKDE